MSELDSLLNTVSCMDGIELMKLLPDKSVDAYITDLPYATTSLIWDEIIPFAPMWAEVKRTLKPRGVFVTTASQPFTSKLVMSNLDWFKYCWVWDKKMATGGAIAEYRPMKAHENICVFSPETHAYYPQYVKRTREEQQRDSKGAYTSPTYQIYGGKMNVTKSRRERDYKNPTTLIRIDGIVATADERLGHPTQKPVALYEYLIRTYTQPDNLVVDFCCGSGTTCLASRNLNRNFIAGDITLEYVEIARKRLAEAYTPLFPAFL